VGKEASGIIVGLPTDAETLNHEAYKRQNYKIGAKVVAVRSFSQPRYGCT